MVQFSLVAMLGLVDDGVLTIEQMVRLMCHNPATLFGISERGFLREGYKADIAIVRRSDTPWTLQKEMIKSKCGWSPLEGRSFHWQVAETMVNGNSGPQALEFER
jgi:dihydroorotase